MHSRDRYADQQMDWLAIRREWRLIYEGVEHKPSMRELQAKTGIAPSTFVSWGKAIDKPVSLNKVAVALEALGYTLPAFLARIEGQYPIDRDSTLITVSSPGESDPTLSAEQVEFLERLAWACLRAADRAERANSRAVLEEMAVSFGHAADPSATDHARSTIREHRARRVRAS